MKQFINFMKPDPYSLVIFLFALLVNIWLMDLRFFQWLSSLLSTLTSAILASMGVLIALNRKSFIYRFKAIDKQLLAIWQHPLGYLEHQKTKWCLAKLVDVSVYALRFAVCIGLLIRWLNITQLTLDGAMMLFGYYMIIHLSSDFYRRFMLEYVI